MRLRDALCGCAAAALLVSASPALAKPPRSAAVVDAATACRALLTDLKQVATELHRQGWRNNTPSIGGTSMAAMTGAYQYRRGADTALLASPGALVAPNCEFRLAGVAEGDLAEAVRQLSATFGSQPVIKPNGMEWRPQAATLFIGRKGDSLVILWLPDSKDHK